MNSVYVGFYTAFILAFIIFSVAGIYHLWRFGYSGDLSKIIIVIYSVVSLAVVVTSVVIISFRAFGG
ncbi:MAG: hypothetical protein WCI57_01905 [Candidatus Berkelbacteria bacterium]